MTSCSGSLFAMFTKWHVQYHGNQDFSKWLKIVYSCILEIREIFMKYAHKSKRGQGYQPMFQR